MATITAPQVTAPNYSPAGSIFNAMSRDLQNKLGRFQQQEQFDVTSAEAKRRNLELENQARLSLAETIRANKARNSIARANSLETARANKAREKHNKGIQTRQDDSIRGYFDARNLPTTKDGKTQITYKPTDEGNKFIIDYEQAQKEFDALKPEYLDDGRLKSSVPLTIGDIQKEADAEYDRNHQGFKQDMAGALSNLIYIGNNNIVNPTRRIGNYFRGSGEIVRDSLTPREEFRKKYLEKANAERKVRLKSFKDAQNTLDSLVKNATKPDVKLTQEESRTIPKVNMTIPEQIASLSEYARNLLSSGTPPSQVSGIIKRLDELKATQTASTKRSQDVNDKTFEANNKANERKYKTLTDRVKSAQSTLNRILDKGVNSNSDSFNTKNYNKRVKQAKLALRRAKNSLENFTIRGR